MFEVSRKLYPYSSKKATGTADLSGQGWPLAVEREPGVTGLLTESQELVSSTLKARDNNRQIPQARRSARVQNDLQKKIYMR